MHNSSFPHQRRWWTAAAILLTFITPALLSVGVATADQAQASPILAYVRDGQLTIAA